MELVLEYGEFLLSVQVRDLSSNSQSSRASLIPQEQGDIV